jgi:uncharacterized protein (TIGR03437 family)
MHSRVRPLCFQLTTESKFAIAPPPFLASTGAKARTMRSMPKTLTSISARSAASEPSANIGLASMIPALLMSRFTSGHDSAAARGSSVAIYATGIGATSPSCTDGLIYQSNIPMATLQVIVGINNEGAQVLYAGQAPGIVSGVAQINVLIPTDAATGVVPLTIKVGEQYSPPGPTIAIK